MLFEQKFVKKLLEFLVINKKVNSGKMIFFKKFPGDSTTS